MRMTGNGNLALRLAAGALWGLGDFRGKARLANSLSDWMIPQDRDLVVEREGARFQLLGRDLLERDLLFGLQTTDRVVRTLSRVCAGKKVLWDVGANIGSVSLRGATNIPTLEVWAFEPSPQNAGRLLRNASLNETLVNRFHCHAIALSDRDGLVPFFASAEQTNSGIGGLHAAGNRGAHPIHVSCTRADTLIDAGGVKRPDVVKIDVEGWELEALRGFGGLLAKVDAPDILVENEPYHLRERGLPTDAIPAYLLAQGYALSFLGHEGELEPYTPSGLDGSKDIWASKRGLGR